jgi:hypothetical protein
LHFNRLIALFCLVLGVFQSGKAQTSGLNRYIDLEYHGTQFTAVLSKFTQLTGYNFAYNNQLLPLQKPIDVHYQNAKADKALRDFLQQHGLDYQVSGNTLILKKWSPTPAPKQHFISGRVTQAQTGERLVKAIVQLPGKQLFTYTDEFGIFKIALPQKSNALTDTLHLQVFYPGYNLYFDTLIGQRDYFLNAALTPAIERLETTLIQANKNQNRLAVVHGQSDQFCLSSARLQQIPALLGEGDVMRALSMNPGVVSGSEGMLGMYVRGGAADQNLVLLDDVPVFNAYHLYGVFGIFNGDIVKSAQLNRGSFSPEHGGRLSSVVSVQSMDGNENQWSGNLSIGALTSKALIQGPLWKKRTTFALAFRRSNFDLLTQSIANAVFKDSNNINRYNFWDVNAKLNHRFSEKSTLSLTLYQGRDRAFLIDRTYGESNNISVFQKREQGNLWGNQLGSIKWQYFFHRNIRFTAKAHYTDYAFTQHNDYQYRLRNEFDATQNKDNFTTYNLTNGLRDMAADAKFDIQFSKFLALKLGGGYIHHTFTPGDRKLETQFDSVFRSYQYNDKKVITPEVFSFAHVEFHHPKWGYLDLGSRISYFGLEDQQFYIRPEPRLSYRYRLSPKVWAKAAASQNVQFFHQLNNLTMGLPSDLWVPSNAQYAPAQARQFSVGTTITQTKYQWSFEYFQKSFNQLLEYRDNAAYITSAQNWEKTVTQGSGNAQGLECLVEKRTGKLTGWASYSLMYNNRQFAELNQGRVFPSRYDRRHNFYLVGIYKFSKNVMISGSWTYNTGFAYTLPIGVYQSPTQNDPYAEIFIYGNRNNARSRDNHRLDLSAQYVVKHKQFQETWSLGIYNVYNRQNPFFITFAYDNQGQRKLTQLSLLPILPHLNYQISF